MVSGDKGFAFPLPRFPSRKGRQSQPCAELGLPLSVESPWKLSESPLYRREETKGWASYAQHHTHPL